MAVTREMVIRKHAYAVIFHGCKNYNFQIKNFNIFLTCALNIDRGYTLELPHYGGSNDYPQFMF